MLSSLVQNVEELIVCRVLMGLATACVQPVAQTIMGDAFPMAQRARLQWMFASAWFVASALGPILASAITFYLSWRLVFLVTVPIGLIASFLMATEYHETVERKSHRIDFAGVFLLGAGVLALLFALSPTNRTGGVGTQSLGLLAVAGVLLALFVWNETRAAEPVLPPRLFLVPVLGIAALGSLASGIVQSGASSFIPIFVQGGQGGTAAQVGMVLPLMTIGFRRTAITGMALTALAQIGFLLLDRDSSTFFAAVCMTVLGLGFGFSSVGFTISVQNSVGWADRGVATASLQFFRSIGGSVGVAIMGTIMGMRMQPLLEQYRLTDAGGGASALLDPQARSALAPEVAGCAATRHDAGSAQCVLGDGGRGRRGPRRRAVVPEGAARGGGDAASCRGSRRGLSLARPVGAHRGVARTEGAGGVATGPFVRVEAMRYGFFTAS